MSTVLASPPPSPPCAGGSVLDGAVVDGWRESLSAGLASPTDLDDTGRLDAIRALEQLACVVTAAQAHLAAELDTSQRAAQAAAGVAGQRQGRGVAAQVGWARRESPHRGQRHLGLAQVVAAELPHTWHAWRTGRITEWQATLVARETACLSLDDRREVDRRVAGDAEALEAMGVRELVGAVQAAAHRLDPASFVARRRNAEADRHVSLRPAPDTMTWLTALLPVAQGVAVHAVLTRAADAARADGDPRGKGQVMADALVAAVLAPDPAAAPTAPAVPVSLGLVLTDHGLFGTVEEPAHLDGFGPIPAELARELVAGACSHDEAVWLRRLYASPTTGALVALDSRRRLFPSSLARFVRLRDRTCRTPWCHAPIRHTDHVTGFADGGPTSLSNAQGLCEACNHAKQAPGWRARPSPDPSAGRHLVETTLPTGHRHRSRAPAVATIRRTPIRFDYVLAG